MQGREAVWYRVCDLLTLLNMISWIVAGACIGHSLAAELLVLRLISGLELAYPQRRAPFSVPPATFGFGLTHIGARG